MKFIHSNTTHYLQLQNESQWFCISGVRAADIARMTGQLWRLLPDDQKEVGRLCLLLVSQQVTVWLSWSQELSAHHSTVYK